MTTTTNLRFLRIVPISLVVSCLLVSSCWGDIWQAPSLTVNLASGRQFTGQIDPRSDGDWLWLRIGRRAAYVVRPIAWDRVLHAARAGEDVSVDQLRENITQLEGILPQSGEVASSSDVLPEKGASSAAAVTPPEPVIDRSREARPRRSTSPMRRLRVTSIRADAWAANWDADVENDGILVQIVAFDAGGHPVPVSGRLDVVLIGPRARRFNDAPRSHGVRFDRLGTWTRRVQADDLDEAGMSFRLPYQATNPQFDDRLGSHALVNVRLSVPGSGTFERTVDYVRIQPFSPLRDYQQLYSGRRWLDIEQTGRGKRTSVGF